MNRRIRVMVEDSRELEELPADDAEILGIWGKAVRSFRDSRLEGLGAESVLVLSYQAGLQVATTVLRAAELRVKDTPKGHHRIAYEGLTALEIPDLSQLGRRLNALRPARHNAIYDWEHGRNPEDAAEVIDIVGQMLPLAHAWLCSQRPNLAATLERP
ncbi:MAG TPA: hypothetical protein VFX98_13745 [Longimicrobiaceae bacterium]|nr:hypothetical protein [Longimicrobiaceae bacterium]